MIEATQRSILLLPHSMINPRFLKICEEALVERMASQSGTVADDEQKSARSRHGDIHASYIGEKADLSFHVRPDEGNDHGLFFATLKAVNAVDLDADLAKQFPQEAYLR